MRDKIDLAALRETLLSEEEMVKYYACNEEKEAQNTALIAAGLKPLHSEFDLKWASDNLAEKIRRVAALKAVIEYFEASDDA